MKCLVLVLSLAAIAAARPDIGLKIREGYQYSQPPATSYGVPTGSYIPAPNSGFQTPHHTFQSHGSNSASNSGFNGGSSFNSGGIGSNGYNNNGYSSSSSSGSVAGYNSGSSSNQFQSGSTGFVGLSNGPAQISKHVYFYDAPEEDEAPQIRIHAQQAAAQKNYKIIFIKAPSYKAPQIPQIPAQAQNEEKTLVYVLVKKQDDIQDIVIPQAAQLKPSKPEVFFIKYKTQKDAEQQIQGIQQGGSSGVIANNVNSDSDFISTIQDTKEFDGSSFQSGNVNTISGEHQSGGDFNQHGASSSSSQSFTSGSTSGSTGSNFGPPGASGPY